MPSDVTNENYVIYWTSPEVAGTFGVAVAALGWEGDRPRPIYRYRENAVHGSENYVRIGERELQNNDGCCWAGWPPSGLSRAEHEKALLALLVRLVGEGIPLDLAIKEFKKIPIFREINIRLPTDVIAQLGMPA